MARLSQYICLGALLFLCGAAFPAAAQVGNSFLADNVAIDLEPSSPQPGETVTATYNDYSGSTFGASLSWTLDGELIPGSTNQRTVTFTLGTDGQPAELELILGLPSGGKTTVTRTITPYYLDVIIEPQTRVPDFYRGRSLPSEGSVVNATALVSDTDSMLSSDLIYTWRVGNKVLEGGPIRGRNQVSFDTPMGEDFILSVEVIRPNGEVVGSRSIRVPSYMPDILFYQIDSLYGISEKSLTNGFLMTGNTATVRAEPYHLDSRVYNDPDHLEFTINGTVSNGGSRHPYEAVLEKRQEGTRVNLEFHVRSLELLIQGARANLAIST